MKCIYPCLGNGDLGFIKLYGPGLANMMLVAARAYCLHKKYDIPMIAPTWKKLSVGPYLRHEKDKRNYFGLFQTYGISGIRKLWYMHHVTHEEGNLNEFLQTQNDAVLRVAGLGHYFQDLDQELTHDFFWKIADRRIRDRVMNIDYSNTVAMHVRLGDYSAEQRTAMVWYERMVRTIYEVNSEVRILLFSDGTNEELSPLLTLPNVKRASGGNALEDILSISCCRLVIASHSTFSAMGAYIGNKPVIFPCRDFPPVFVNNGNELVSSDEMAIKTFVQNII